MLKHQRIIDQRLRELGHVPKWDRNRGHLRVTIGTASFPVSCSPLNLDNEVNHAMQRYRRIMKQGPRA